LGETSAPPGESHLLLHGILYAHTSPFAIQEFALERTWDGVNYVWQAGPPYSPSDPILTGGGTPEVRAVVELTTPTGEVVRAQERNATDVNPCCAGMYQFFLQRSSLVAGGRYRLTIQTTDGQVLTAQATMPAMPPLQSLSAEDFDRTTDTLRITWEPVAYAAAYELVIENAYSNFRIFTESTTVRLTGLLRNVDAEGFPSAFLPGFTQRISVIAVDTNYYDYYRSRNGLRGRGLVNRIAGGYGVFGAGAPVLERTLRVNAPFTRPAEGEYRYYGTVADSLITLITRLTLHVESPSSKADAVEGLSGTYRARPRALAPFYFDTAGAFVGKKWRDSIEVAFLSQQRMTDTMEVFRARVVGDTIIGRYRQRLGTWRFVKN
jgi:hypothetical protein